VLTPRSTLAEVAEHKTRDDVWMTIHNKVYNVSKYLEDHPGGEEVLMDRAGHDATEDFEDVGHSNEARKKLAEFEIGEPPPSEHKAAGESSSGGGGGGSGMVIGIIGAVVAAGAGYYYMTYMQ
jgi:cytochrome b5